MATTLDNLIAAEATERADLATLSGLVTQIIAAVAAGTLNQTQATALLAAMNADDATVKTSITAIQTALGTNTNPPPPGP